MTHTNFHAVMMMKDEEENLPRCLKSIRNLCDEIIIIDTGSTDNSVRIAREFGAKVYPGHFNWRKPPIFDFSLHRNTAFQYAEEHRADWMLVIDADEELVVPTDYDIFRQRLTQLPPHISGLVAIVHEMEDDEIQMSWYGGRVFRARRQTWYDGIIHNEVKLEQGWMAGSDIVINHYGYKEGPTMDAKRQRTLTSIEKRLKEDPNDYNAWFYKCITCAGAKRYQDSIDAGHKCLEILSTLDNVVAEPQSEMNFYGLIYYHLGFSFLRLNDGTKAYWAYRKGYDIWPDDLDLNYALAELGYFAKDNAILKFHGRKYLEILDKYNDEMKRELPQFQNPVKFKDMALSTRHVMHGKKKHKEYVLRWLNGIKAKAA